jgi:hypothetical protein
MPWSRIWKMALTVAALGALGRLIANWRILFA